MKTHDRFGFQMTLLAIGSGVATLALAALLAGCGRSDPDSTGFPVSTNDGPGALASTTTDSSGSGSTAPAETSSTVSSQTPPPMAIPTPDEAKAALHEGTKLFDAGDWETASERLTVATAGRPDDARAHYLLGLAHWKAGRAADAERALGRSAELNAGSVRTWVNLARVRLDRADDTAALEAAEKACALSPDAPDALHQKGRALGRLGRVDEAVETLTRALELAPDNGYIANSLGNTLLQAGRAEDAIPSLETARDRIPHIAFVRNNLGVAYERTGRRDEAVAEYHAAVSAGDSGGKAAASLARLGVPLSPEHDATGIARTPQTPTGSAGPTGPDGDGSAGGSN